MRVKHAFPILIVATLSMLVFSGCEVLLAALQPNTTSVRLINTTQFPVEVDLYYGDEQNTIEDILTTTGTHRSFSLAAGETQTFIEDCDEFQAVVIEKASLQLIGDIGPEDGTDVLRDGDDFNCGDQITFTFEGGVTDLDIIVDVSQQ